MAAHQLVATLIFRLMLPLVLSICAVLRFSLMSLAYLVMVMVVPLLPAPTFYTMRGHTGRFLRVLVGLSIVNFLLQFTFQIVLLSLPPYGSFLTPCEFLETLMRHLGVVRLDHVSEEDGSRWLLPECILVVFSPGVLVACLKLTTHASPHLHLPAHDPAAETHKNIGLRILNAVGTYLAVAVIGAAGVMVPSLPSAIYFLVFVVTATYCSLNNPLGRRFGYVCRGVMVVAGVHVLSLYVYQTQWAQEYLPPASLAARLLGMTALVGTDCTDPRSAPLSTDEWSRFLNPVLLLVLYYVLSFESQFLLSNKAALLSPVGSSVRYLIRRSTIRSRSIKSGRSSASEASRSRRTSFTHQSRRRLLPESQEAGVAVGGSSLGSGLGFGQDSDPSWDAPLPLCRNPSIRDSACSYNTTSARSLRSSYGPNGSLPSKLCPRSFQSEARSERSGCLLSPPLSSTTQPEGSEGTRVEGDVEGSSNVGVDSGGAGVGGGGGEKGEPEEEHPLQRLIYPLISVFQLVIRSSYIATNIVMMAWSITYHSWLTFVLLLWACVLWMIPNQRAAMLRCSPFLVIYAELLLLIQYIYCMDLTEEELPSQVEAVNLSQIGLVKYPTLPCKPLMVKVLYTTMFWLTLRQYVQEVVEVTKREMSSAAALQPFTVAVSTTSSGQPVTTLISSHDEQTSSPVMQRVGQWLRGLLVKFWIWLVAIMLFIFGIQGSEVVIFRIMYMVLFLIFTITFQLSYSAWRNFLYGFWLTVIVYQMVVLVLTYTYQFDNFPQYWENYTRIPIQLQKDMGLEVYDTGRLFVQLMTPTFFVIVTIIQVHYFHKDFLELSDIEQKPDQPPVKEAPKDPKKPKPPGHSAPNLLESCTLEDIRVALEHYGRRLLDWLQAVLGSALELGWRFLEIHLMKIVLGSVITLACYDVCPLHWAFAILASVAVPCPERIQTAICRTCVVLSSFLLIARMIYQIDYIDPEEWAADCSIFNNETAKPYPLNTTADNAAWTGLTKTDNLPKYLKGYIGIIVVITVQAVVGIRQQYQRKVTGLPPPPLGVLFPNVTRAVADDGIVECLKFLLNYGFYKFGVEICLMSLVAVIGTRLDVYSLFYAAWLCYFYNRERRGIARVWKGFVIFITILIPLQYLMCVGIPPGICTDYPWAGEMDPELREWLFFPDFVKPPESYKIVTDFCLLIFAVSQQRVFEIEFADGAESYEGGSNKEIVHEDQASLVNPIPDFVTYARSTTGKKNYLDMVKVVIFFTSYWITLAVMFLGGTNRVTLFAMGYVMGAFTFLWQGNEFYLRPLNIILRLWNLLLGYNVGVIVVKTFLQLLGCVFLEPLAIHTCWLVQLLGIACVKKFGDTSDEQIVEALADHCAVPKSEAGLMWDGICFGFLLMQRRLFCSFYFQHLVTEMKAQTKLASRGAELIAELMQKEIAEQQAAEREVLNKIKEKMERIKASQQLVQNQQIREPASHYEGVDDVHGLSSPRPLAASATPGAPTPSSANLTFSLDGYLEPTRLSLTTPHFSHQPITSPSEESFPFFSPPPYPALRDRHAPTRASAPATHDIGPPWLREHLAYHRPSVSTTSPAMSHHTSIRSGDYYMFEDYGEYDGLEIPEEPTQEDTQGLTVSELLSSALKTDIVEAAEEARTARLSESDATSRRSSYVRRPVRRTLSGRSQVSMASRTSRTTSRSVRIHPRPRSPPAVPHSPPPLPLSSPPRRSPLASGRPPPPSTLPPLPPIPQLDGGYLADDSTAHDYSEIEPAEPQGLAPILRKIVHWAKFGWEFLESLMISATQLLNRLSKDYRYVACCLSEEKKRLKETEGFRVMPGAPPLPPLATTEWSDVPLSQNGYGGGQEPLEIRVEKASEDKTDDSVDLVDIGETAEKDFKKEQPPLVKLIIALWYAMLSRSELVCYIMIFVNQIKSASVLSLPLPFLVFLWGSLSVPRPTKSFWITVIAYTEIIVVVKYLFQFDFFPWNQVERLNAPFWPPRIIGIEKKNRYAVYDLALLLVVFFHRFMLKSLGLWKETSDMTPTVTARTSPAHTPTSSPSSTPRGARKGDESTLSAPTSKEDGDASTLSYTKDTSLLSKDTHEEESLFSKDTKVSSSPTSKDFKDISLTSTGHTRDSSLPTTLREASLTWQEQESSLLLNANDESLPSRASEPLPGSSPSHYLPLSEGSQTPLADPDSDVVYRQRAGSETAGYRRPWMPGQHARHSSLVSQVPGGAETTKPRTSSLVVRPEHRRHLSEGSRVSFSQRAPSLTSHCTHISQPSQSGASDSVHVTCAACNLQALRDLQKPDFEEVKENLQQLPRIARGGAEKQVSKVRGFLDRLLHQESQVSVDVYAYMFFCDFFNFFVLIFGFAAFGTQQGDGGVRAYLEDNRVPIPFLVMLILQFGLIIVDRALFLRKFILGKLIFQVTLTFGIHIWMFFILPAVTEREFNAKRPPQIWYMVKCLNLLLSAYQIRCGYPTRILGNFLCKQYNYLNYFSFRLFMTVPFLFELRTLMDWIWTNTSMSISDWVKMEDIFSHIFRLKCERRAEIEYPQGRGESKRKIIKYGMGGCALFGVIAFIWFPLVLFALSNTVGQPNPPYDVTVQITVGAYQPIFRMTAQQQSLTQFSQTDWYSFNYHYRTDRQAQTFLSNYDFSDVVMAELNGNSTAIWGISPPAQQRLIMELQSNHTIKLKIDWMIKRPSNGPDIASECKDQTEVNLEAYKGQVRNPMRERLVRILEGELEQNPVMIPNLFPKFLKVTNKGQAEYVPQLEDKSKGFVDLQLTLQSAGFADLASRQEWWEVQENCENRYFDWLPHHKHCRFLTIYTFNDKTFPKGLSFISGGGIVGMYTTLVLVAGKMLRGYFAGSALKIMFDDLPNVDRIMQLCLDIYLVRESNELELEEDLFAKLVFLFRSPETLIKWTRPPEEETPEGEEGDPQLE
ncbi:piezo-type mechanosensitive ion channel component-like isoform X3 [Eriocheir sinensis]|uniref:piezo-type mechanosensitive ion channel component-like isoform X3 n=1 Tax=Eriocheir sinensis TaxID=95602 RepID=UPI0021C581B2|nr:piezo-type mechanosensitive ion channel component-like isoform X3 [Eriocheir sinensis]